MMPLALSTTKPVAYEDEATSVSKLRVCVTLQLQVEWFSDMASWPKREEQPSAALEDYASRDNVVQCPSPTGSGSM